MSIGRLDETSEGLVLLTTDGKMSERVRRKSVEKEYYIEVDGIITDEAVEQLKNGVEISTRNKKYLTLPCAAHRLDQALDIEPGRTKIRGSQHGPTSWLSVTLCEGKFRQVRKMSAVVGFPVLRLIRVRIGNVQLNDLGAGEVVEVDDFDVRIVE